MWVSASKANERDPQRLLGLGLIGWLRPAGADHIGSWSNEPSKGCGGGWRIAFASKRCFRTSRPRSLTSTPTVWTLPSRPSSVITGHGDVAMSVTAMKAGAVVFLTKPFAGKDLLDAIQRAVERDTRDLGTEARTGARDPGRVSAPSPRASGRCSPSSSPEC